LQHQLSSRGKSGSKQGGYGVRVAAAEAAGHSDGITFLLTMILAAMTYLSLS
jgi:hypothetical protein